MAKPDPTPSRGGSMSNKRTFNMATDPDAAQFEVTTSFNQDLIHQRTFDPTGQIVERVIRLQDQGIRKALIALGWTPPPDQEKE